MEQNRTPSSTADSNINTGSRRSCRRTSLSQEEEVLLDIGTGGKRKRNPTESNMSKNKKVNSGECTNAQLMSTLDKLAEKMDELPNKRDLRDVEAELTNKIYQTSMKFEKKIQDNSRQIRAIGDRLEKQENAVTCLLYTSPSPRDS